MNFLKKIPREIFYFLTSGIFLKNFALMVGLVSIVIFLTMQWINLYTKHGESKQISDYTGMNLDEAIEKAKNNSFTAIVSDSFYEVGKPGGLIIDQNPSPFSRVKENRTVYLTVTSYDADMVPIPGLIGGNDAFAQYSRLLKLKEVDAEIRERRFDARLEENTILEVFYKDENITDKLYDEKVMVEVPRGGKLEFIVSERGGTAVAIPKLVCQKFDAAKFVVANYNLNIGSVIDDATVTSRERAYVWKQVPAFSESGEMRVGEQINIYLTQYVPNDCKGGGKKKPIAEKPKSKPAPQKPKPAPSTNEIQEEAPTPDEIRENANDIIDEIPAEDPEDFGDGQ